MNLAAPTSQAELVGNHSGFRIARFELARPATVDETLLLMREGATVMGGGLDLVERMKAGLSPHRVASLSRVEALKTVSFDGETLKIGAGMTHRAVSSDASVNAAFPHLARIWGGIGNVRIRARGTVGGNLMAAMPGYEGATILAACGAEVVFGDIDGRTRVSAAQAVDASGLLLHVAIAEPGKIKLSIDRSLRDYALVARGDFSDGRVIVALGGLGRNPLVAISDKAEIPALSGPHADYLSAVLPRVLERMRDG